MTYEPRSRYEYGDDPAAAEEARDHLLAHARGLRLAGIADAIVSKLDGAGMLPDREDATVLIFGVLADLLYGNHAIDVPTLRGRGETP
jgi:hypothetical protein